MKLLALLPLYWLPTAVYWYREREKEEHITLLDMFVLNTVLGLLIVPWFALLVISFNKK